VKKLKRNTKVDAKLRQCYVYEIRIDGVVRYVGKGPQRSHLLPPDRRKAHGQQIRRQD
jgi:hypothetical protein